MRLFIILLLISSISAETIFTGIPNKKIEIQENSVLTTQLFKNEALEYKVIISIKDGKYFWESRGNVELKKIESGVYETYIATNGSGYIRVLKKTMRDLYKKMTEEDKEKNYLYSEHLVNQLGSITYIGR